MTVLVFGQNGQVATELRQLEGVISLGRNQANLEDPQSCAFEIRTHAPKAVINAAAYTAVDRAEKEEALATRINGDAPALMAKVCAELDIPFVHVSTDYIFDGTGERPRRPDDHPAPPNSYGRSKLAGEDGVRAVGGRYAILRTSWVFSAHGTNFVRTMLRLSATRDELNVVDDQIGGPTSARDIAQACVTIAKQLRQDPSKSGTYHLTGTPDVSWYSFAQEIFRRTGRSIAVNPISTHDYPTPALRPLNSRLDCRQTEEKFGISRPDWKRALDDVLNELEME
ncbi:dTDP-4-dehydrorhamnose reductase [Aliiroseovarius sp. PrR006]|uniref:dTDP-4-dehydrorhamnose reductase n=1 Tax=Aliiroseovarius sp. PrR006 TaxID=2706883 RepID=UPI0013D12B7A|nr:dTDP-4-dehydrorhamnose reductase [Aliiroseovarius sp. PrR006]NDW52439.1 dTDP-4-dehydrorhamnose reductase [Aliiroseovarius sp. PrR006]